MPLERSNKINTLRRSHLFRNLDDQKLEFIADSMEEVEYPAGSPVFQAGEDADYFYLIHTGKVRIYQPTPELQMQSLGVLEKAEYFGQEVLESDWPRQVAAEAEIDSVILRINVPAFRNVLEVAPGLGGPLQMILDSYRLMLRKRFEWLDENEFVYYISRRHVLFLVLKLLPPILTAFILVPLLLTFSFSVPMLSPVILFGAALLATIGWLVWAYVDWTNDYYIVTKTRIVYQERVILLYDSRQEAPLEAIQSSSSNTSQIGRLLGYGNVIIRTYFGTVLFKQVFAPEQVMALVQDRQYYKQVAQVYDEVEDIQRRLRDRIAFGPKMPPPLKGSLKPQVKPTQTQEFLATLLHQRFEVGGTIIYRTHMLILLRKTFLPLLTLLAVIALAITSATSQFAILPLQSTCGLTFLAGIFAFGWLAYQYMDWHNDVYLITPDQVVDVNKKPLGHEERRAAPLNKIQNIEYKRLGIVGLLFNYGTVYIQVGDTRLTFDEVHRPSDVQRELFHSLSRRQQKDREAQMENERVRMANWIATYNDMVKNNPSQDSPPPARRGF